MITIRKSDDRGHADHGWLKAKHSFSFADYFDPKNMHFRTLRVLNEDRVAPAQGFGTHGHKDMEILTWVLDGALEHRDSMGNTGVIRPGEAQRMTAGRGVRHSEFNASTEEPLHLLQIWLLPEKNGLTPGYEQRKFPREDREGRLRLIASPDAAQDSVVLHQDARVYNSILKPGRSVEHKLDKDRGAWVHVATGAVKVNGQDLKAGDAAAIEKEDTISITGAAPESEVMLFDLA